MTVVVIVISVAVGVMTVFAIVIDDVTIIAIASSIGICVAVILTRHGTLIHSLAEQRPSQRGQAGTAM
eukprot:6398011-Pyramimonas_sp.AAC.1